MSLPLREESAAHACTVEGEPSKTTTADQDLRYDEFWDNATKNQMN